MKIRSRLTFQFVGIVALLMLVSCLAIYYLSANYRENEFYDRLLTKSQNTAKLLLEVDEIDISLLERIEENNPLSLPNEHILIYNFDNQILYNSDRNTDFDVSSDLLDQIRLEKDVRFKRGDLEVLGYLFTDKYDRIVVISAGTDLYGNRKIKNLTTILFIVFCSSVVFILIMGWVYAGRAISPINNVITQAKRIGFSSLNLRIDEGKNRYEIASLASTFNEMLDRLEKSVQIQKNFIANASHEMRTPLTAITGQLEVLLRRERTQDQYKETAQSILEDIENLNSTTNRLLLLAQTADDKAADGYKIVRIDDILWNIKSELEKRNSLYKVEINFSLLENEDEYLSVEGNAQLLRVALINLIENACKYSANQTAQVFIENDDTGLVLRIVDTGIGISEDDLTHIFEPFFRGKNVSNIRGHGIGLSLTKRIIQLHNGGLTAMSVENRGSTFVVSFANFAQGQ